MKKKYGWVLQHSDGKFVSIDQWDYVRSLSKAYVYATRQDARKDKEDYSDFREYARKVLLTRNGNVKKIVPGR